MEKKRLRSYSNNGKFCLSRQKKNKKTSEHQKERLSKYNRRIKELEKKLKTYKEKLKENEVLRTKLKHGEKKILKLKEDIIHSKQQKVALSKKIKAKSNQYKIWMKEKEHKVKRIQKESRKIKHLMNKMKNQNSKQALVLKRSLLQEQILRKKLKTLTEKKPKVIIKRVNPSLTSSIYRMKSKTKGKTTAQMYRHLLKKKHNNKENLVPRDKKNHNNGKDNNKENIFPRDNKKHNNGKVLSKEKLKIDQTKKKSGLKPLNVKSYVCPT